MRFSKIIIFLLSMFKIRMLFYRQSSLYLYFTIDFWILPRRLHYGGKVKKAENRKRPRHTCRHI